MKLRLVATALLSVLLLIPASGPASATPVPHVPSRTLHLEFWWQGDSPLEANWYLSDDHTFFDSYGLTGTWSFDGRVITVVYNGCDTTYKGIWFGTYFQGVMRSCDSSDGIWRARPLSGGASDGRGGR